MEDINNSYLSFKVGTELFAIHVGRVSEICEYQEPRKIPETVSFMTGVIDHRDEVIPVIDTGLKFGMKAVEITAQTCIVVVDVTRKDTDTSFRVGILTDAVTDVFEVNEEEFKQVDTDYSPGYIKATCSVNNNFYLILNSDKVFSVNEIIGMGDVLNKIKK
ncbi:chemotaxis protein CheW [Plebeiibacterium marinum]|uniref:Chemotaxis protein CheW n=1 Tax=Plebeiibacterium marinum TaxID=2992111 RepID=A0AAE3MF81_9BACT|nr:chemotaxis protein CheW [Plebeiobacterium marinum]MCW3806414.1 chemotaxis protein CheW [Plebeiobacterium marinum]